MENYVYIAALACIAAFSSSLEASTITGAPLVPCVTGTLASYIDGSNSSCALGILVSTSWNLNPSNPSGAPTGSATGGATLLNSSQIIVTPTVEGLAGTFSFTAADPSNGFSVSMGQTEDYFIEYSYYIDPGPYADGANLRLDNDPGNVTVTQSFCNDSVVVNVGHNASCAQTVQPQFLQVTTQSPVNSIVFNPPALFFGAVQTEIFLDGTNGPVSFTGIDSGINVVPSAPEPATCFLFAGGLLVIGVRRKFAKRS